MRTAAVVLLAIASASAHAQPTSSPAGRAGSWVRVEAGSEIAVGRLVALDSLGFLVVRTPEADRAVARGAVTGLWERVPAPRRGARVGALVGGLVGGSVLTALNYGWCEYDCDRALNAAVGVGVGAAVGGGVGAARGALVGRWVQRYP